MSVSSVFCFLHSIFLNILNYFKNDVTKHQCPLLTISIISIWSFPPLDLRGNLSLGNCLGGKPFKSVFRRNDKFHSCRKTMSTSMRCSLKENYFPFNLTFIISELPSRYRKLFILHRKQYSIRLIFI